MPKGIYKHIKGKCTNTGKTHIKQGQRLSPKTEYKNGQKAKNWNGFKEGQYPWNYGSRNFEPYGRGWTNILRESIRLRDNYKCQKCGVPQEECNEALHIHHKNGIKPDLDPDNLVSLRIIIYIKIKYRRPIKEE